MSRAGCRGKCWNAIIDFALMASEPGDRDLEAFPLLKMNWF